MERRDASRHTDLVHLDRRRAGVRDPAPGPEAQGPVLPERPAVSVSVDDAGAWPYKALLVRGTASVEMEADVVPEYAQAAERYLGREAGAAWVSQLAGQPMARVAVVPTRVAVLDFETRFPSALTS